jgi:D-cysteine desulfhydrase family pyridoxal phosphate-dependent enzyme
LDQLTKQLERIPLAYLPTPLEEMKNLRRELDKCPRILIKRDDQTGLATGGNKTRKLEFLIADALQAGADTVITTGGVQSNHCRQTAAAATKHNLRCVLVVPGQPLPKEQWDGNLLLSDLLGAEVVWAGELSRDAVIEETVANFKRVGAKPYVIPIGGSVPLGAAGYVAAMEELVSQLIELEEELDRIIVTSGSGGTHAGILVGVKALSLNAKVEGMSNMAIDDLEGTVRKLSMETANFLGLELEFGDEDFIFHDACGKHGYGVITDSEREGIRLLARTEGIILDPIYTGRAFAQMIALIREGVYSQDETILFWHTGGVSGLFPRAGEL